MDMIRVSAKTLDEAITKASIELGITSNNLEYTVVEKGSSGLLGFIGTKPVVIQAKKKKEIAESDDLFEEKKEMPVKESAPIKDEPVKSVEKEEVTVKEVDSVACEVAANRFLSQIFAAMAIEVDIKTHFNMVEKELCVDLSGENMGILIGKRGQTLDSLQYLVSLVVNRDCDGYVRVKLDTENYRARRKDTLESLAKNIAYKVKRTKRPVSLEPMNPYERRIIHSALQNDKYVVTRSEGEDPFRHVVISLKRENRNN